MMINYHETGVYSNFQLGLHWFFVSSPTAISTINFISVLFPGISNPTDIPILMVIIL